MKEQCNINSVIGGVMRKPVIYAWVPLFLVLFLCNPSIGWSMASDMVLKGRVTALPPCPPIYYNRSCYFN